MPRANPLREIKRLQTPAPGPLPLTAELLDRYLSAEQSKEVVGLLRDGPTSWQRRYKPQPEHAAHVAELLIACAGDLATVELLPA
jgi:hypothetical protein